MSDKEARLFEVQHPERPAVQVQAVDRLRAVAAAAREWGDRWTEIARDCEVTDLGPAPEQKRKSRRTTRFMKRDFARCFRPPTRAADIP